MVSHYLKIKSEPLIVTNKDPLNIYFLFIDLSVSLKKAYYPYLTYLVKVCCLEMHYFHTFSLCWGTIVFPPIFTEPFTYSILPHISDLSLDVTFLESLPWHSGCLIFPHVLSHSTSYFSLCNIFYICNYFFNIYFLKIIDWTLADMAQLVGTSPYA